MQADEVQNAKEPIAAQIDLSGQTLSLSSSETLSMRAHERPNWSRRRELTLLERVRDQICPLFLLNRPERDAATGLVAVIFHPVVNLHRHA